MTSDLEARLVELRDAAFPATPDIASAVLPRMEPVRAPRAARRRLVLGLAAGLAVLLAAAAVAAPVRERVLDALGIGGVRISSVEQLPRPARRGPELGSPVTLAQARSRLPFPVRLPRALGPPEAVFFSSQPPGGQVALVYGDLVLTQFRGDVGPLIEKTLGSNALVERVDVDGARGVRITGPDHVLVYLDPRGRPQEETVRAAGDVLVWTRDGVTLRLEGPASRERALSIARSVR
jgi:hypothetical protein